jgi:large conductance mechanosensitive channel
MGMAKSLIQEFKDFAIKGNAIDLAVGVVIGSAFGGVVNSLVNDVIMPPLGLLTGGVDFKDKHILLKPATTEPVVKAVDLTYGTFLNTLVSFFIVALAIFMVVKLMSLLQREKAAEPAAPPPPTPEQQLLTEIRDLLKGRANS